MFAAVAAAVSVPLMASPTQLQQTTGEPPPADSGLEPGVLGHDAAIGQDAHQRVAALVLGPAENQPPHSPAAAPTTTFAVSQAASSTEPIGPAPATAVQPIGSAGAVLDSAGGQLAAIPEAAREPVAAVAPTIGEPMASPPSQYLGAVVLVGFGVGVGWFWFWCWLVLVLVFGFGVGWFWCWCWLVLSRSGALPSLLGARGTSSST